MNRNGALAGIITSAVVVIWKRLSGGLFDLYEILPGFAFSLLAIVIFSLATKPPAEEIIEEFEEAKEASL